jgi:hypothetical protein
MYYIKNMSSPESMPVQNMEKKEVPQCKIEILNVKDTDWKNIKKDILGIENACFDESIRYEKEDLKEDFYKKDNIVILIRLEDGSKKIIGYTYTEPSESGNPEVAEIVSTAILPEYRHMGFLGKLIDTLESELKRRKYEFIERDAMIKGGYSEQIKKHYGEKQDKDGNKIQSRILEQYPSKDNDGDDDDREYFLIKL